MSSHTYETSRACSACASEKQRQFPADIKIYFDQARTAATAEFRFDVRMWTRRSILIFRCAGYIDELQAFRRTAGE
jgi:Holliday junction resolvase-like predicted endonuclease